VQLGPFHREKATFFERELVGVGGNGRGVDRVRNEDVGAPCSAVRRPKDGSEVTSSFYLLGQRRRREHAEAWPPWTASAWRLEKHVCMK
jgi:hypothetical protein